MSKNTSTTADGLHKVVIIGGGFGGLYAARDLAGKNVSVTLVDRRNHHLFQPLLYQVATGGLSPAHIAHPLRSVFARDKNVRVLMDEVVHIDPFEKSVTLSDAAVRYDSLIVAAGASSHYFGNDEWETAAPSLKSIEDATRIRQTILTAFEKAERTSDTERRKALLTFAVVGGGPTGVELAGTLGEIANYTLREDVRSIDPSDAKIVLIEAGEKILPSYRDDLGGRARADLEDLGVNVLTKTSVREVSNDSLTLESEERTYTLGAHTVLWAAGVKASPLAQTLAGATNAESDRSGRLYVTQFLNLPGHEDVFVIGDMAHCKGPDRNPLPGVAPVAMQQGRHAAATILRRIAGKEDLPFAYRDRGSMATIGRSRAIAQIGSFGFGGTPAWMAWLFVHLMYLVAFENRVLVLTQWTWNYFTWNRGARIITEAATALSGARGGQADSKTKKSAEAA
jgi:NADH dehydrogenase